MISFYYIRRLKQLWIYEYNYVATNFTKPTKYFQQPYLSNKRDLSIVLCKPCIHSYILEMAAVDKHFQSVRRHVGFRLVLVQCVNVEVYAREPHA